MKSLTKVVLAATFSSLFLFPGKILAQENVGIGTLTPNPKAILDLSATDKGFLVPRMTSVERMAITPTGAGDAGLLVYDTNDSLFYFWNTFRWHPFPSPLSDGDWKVSGNNMYAEVSGNVGVGTVSPQAKLHTVGALRFAGLTSGTNNDVLVINGNGDVRYRNLGNDIWDGDDVDDADHDAFNECITSMFFNSSNNTLSIVDACGVTSEVISINSNDNDADPTNEIQNLTSQTTGNNVTINISGGTSTSFTVDDGDANPTNEIQMLSVSQSGNTINWNLNQGGGSGSFNLDDNDWVGAGTGKMYPSTISDNIGIGTVNPSFILDVNGNMRANNKLYFNNTDFYIERNGLDLYHYSNDDMRFVSGNDHITRFYHSGSEAITNFNQDGQDVLTLRGAGTYSYGVGIGTTTPTNKLQVAGDVRVGLINPAGFTNGGNNYGNLIYFSGGPGYSGGSSINSDNNDLLFIGRYNAGPDASELRVGIGDDPNSSSSSTDRFSIGAYNSASGINSFQGLFDFEIENPGSSNGPMLSISPFGTSHVKDYHGALSITKPLTTNGQYINLVRGSSTVWSIGYQYNTPRFAISEGSSNDAAFAATTPHFTILNGSGYVGLGVSSPSYRLELPNDASTNGRGRAEMWVTYSDGRFKKNREDFGNVLSKVMQLKPIYYQWEKYTQDATGKIQYTGILSERKDMGFIAQDVFKYFPEVVQKPEDENTDVWSMDYARLTVVLTKAIQEQQQMLEAERAAHQETKKELRDLKSEVESLKGRFQNLEAELNKGNQATTDLK